MSNKLHSISIVALIILYVSPVIISYLMTLMPNTPVDQDQWAVLQAILMGVYNIPLVVVSAVLLFFANKKRMSNTGSSALYYTSILVSVIGICLMLIWGIFKP